MDWRDSTNIVSLTLRKILSSRAKGMRWAISQKWWRFWRDGILSLCPRSRYHTSLTEWLRLEMTKRSNPSSKNFVMFTKALKSWTISRLPTILICNSNSNLQRMDKINQQEALNTSTPLLVAMTIMRTFCRLDHQGPQQKKLISLSSSWWIPKGRHNLRWTAIRLNNNLGLLETRLWGWKT